MTATGIWLYPDGTVGELVEAVVRADAAGIDEVWIADEGVMRDPAVVIAAAASATQHIRFGIGITTPALRHPGVLASTVATLDELTGGRMMLGLGVGGEHSLAPFGVVVDKPVAMMRDALQTARAVLQREDSDGYRVPPHAAPARDVPIYVASRGEQINRLASREADGVFVSGFAPDRLETVLGWVRSARAVRVALYQSVRFRDDGSPDPTTIVGSPEELAGALAALVTRHRPDSIGVALVDGDPLAVMMERAVATVEALQRLSSRG
jgi:alkanesulfonate monooxygenase SsuD/methylene tetrahydromethanopterin reductase-like flavin-dependent oxidoreductase (luciferase family)